MEVGGEADGDPVEVGGSRWKPVEDDGEVSGDPVEVGGSRWRSVETSADVLIILGQSPRCNQTSVDAFMDRILLKIKRVIVLNARSCRYLCTTTECVSCLAILTPH